MAGSKTWTGNGGDENWLNPLNWSGNTIPESIDDIILDNGDLPISFTVRLPDNSVVVKSIAIRPAPGRIIELLLPPTNTNNNALWVSGPGYGLDLSDGAIFRNSSGILSGESIRIADSIIIRNGARYIHQTRASHANGILAILSTAPGTELGIFDFNVPRASYTISLSNRTYGSIEFHSDALGSNVNYTSSGSNPVKIRGNIRLGAGVNLSLDLSGTNGYVQIDGDFTQEAGQLNLSSGMGDNTIFHIGGDVYQTSNATITETNNGHPYIEFNGSRIQQINVSGRILNEVGLRIKNKAGVLLNLPLILPWELEMDEGQIFSSAMSMLILDKDCKILADTTNQTGSFVNGPLKKIGLDKNDHFLFPVGKNDAISWLELNNVTGTFTVEYFHENPGKFGTTIGPGLDHISKTEYWTIVAENPTSSMSNIELSYSWLHSGGITNPDFLRVSKFINGFWMDAGNSSKTGNLIQGSVTSDFSDFTAEAFTLASTLNLENPLPVIDIDLKIQDLPGSILFIWSCVSDLTPEHFELFEVTDSGSVLISKIKAVEDQKTYRWQNSIDMFEGNHFFRLDMIDDHGSTFSGKIIKYRKMTFGKLLKMVPSSLSSHFVQLYIELPENDVWCYDVLSLDGKKMESGKLYLNSGSNLIKLETRIITGKMFIFRAENRSGQTYSMIIVRS